MKDWIVYMVEMVPIYALESGLAEGEIGAEGSLRGATISGAGLHLAGGRE